MSTNSRICPACDKGTLIPAQYTKSVSHQGVSGFVDQVKLQCPVCNADLFDNDCLKQNRRAWVSFQKQVEGIPTGQAIRKWRAVLGVTSQQLGTLIGGGPKAFSKYENDEIIPRDGMRTLLNYLIRHPERINEVLSANGKPPLKGVAQHVVGAIIDHTSVVKRRPVAANHPPIVLVPVGSTTDPVSVQNVMIVGFSETGQLNPYSPSGIHRTFATVTSPTSTTASQSGPPRRKLTGSRFARA